MNGTSPPPLPRSGTLPRVVNHDPERPSAQVVVLLEGRSDVAALEVLTATRGLATDTGGFHLVDMGGATNVRRHVRALLHSAYPPTLLGLCDAREAPYFLRGLRAEGFAVHDERSMAEHGFHVCHVDLEDELIRALGPRETLGVLQDLGLDEQFDTFGRQPAWRGRPLHHQLRRFAGTTSGRKATFDAALASVLSPTRVPAPLVRLLNQLSALLSAP